MNLGIEIGGTKLQFGIGNSSDSKLTVVRRSEVNRSLGANGILEEISKTVTALLQKHDVENIGIGFGGPVDSKTGIVTTSHSVLGWDNFPLVDWCQKNFARPTFIANDCDTATLAESRLGAGKDCDSIFYVTVGTGIGGGFSHKGQVFGMDAPSIAEIGHMRPSVSMRLEGQTVESIASGLGIANTARARIAHEITTSTQSIRFPEPFDRGEISSRVEAAIESGNENIDDLLRRCGNDPEQLTGKHVAQAAQEGNQIAEHVFNEAIAVLGWAIAQVITLVAPNKVIVGGGVSLAGEQFFAPLRKEVQAYVFPPLSNWSEILPTKLGELIVVHGAILLPEVIAERHDSA